MNNFKYGIEHLAALDILNTLSLYIFFFCEEDIMELGILYWINALHSPVLDRVMVAVFNNLVGSKGEIWIILGIVLLLIPKTRKTGVCVLSAYIIAYYVGDGILKDLIARPRPCMVDESVSLLVSRPSSFSCPSVHSMLAFASAASVFWFHKKTGIVTLIFAALIGLSRMYFFVHYPSDVLFGALLGFAIGTAVCVLFKKADGKKFSDE